MHQHNHGDRVKYTQIIISTPINNKITQHVRTRKYVQQGTPCLKARSGWLDDCAQSVRLVSRREPDTVPGADKVCSARWSRRFRNCVVITITNAVNTIDWSDDFVGYYMPSCLWCLWPSYAANYTNICNVNTLTLTAANAPLAGP